MTSTTTPDQPPHADGTVIWAGSYTPDSDGNGLGLTPLSAGPDGGLAPAGAAFSWPSPSFVVAHPSLPVLYSADEGRETVSAFAIGPADPTVLTAIDAADPTELTALGSQPAGPAVCHVAVDPDGGFVAATCWGGGQVLIYPLSTDGRLGAPVPAPEAADPHAATRPPHDENTDAAPTSRAHMTLVLDRASDGSRMLATTDLGYDLVRFWAWTPAGDLVAAGQVVLPLGCGPRHLVRIPDGRLLVVTEYSVEVAVLEPAPVAAAGSHGAASSTAPFRLAGTVPVLDGGPSEGDSGAEIALSDDARHVYVGVRGSNRIATLEVDGTGIRPVAQTPSGGRTPRHHLVSGGLLHVAHQDSDEVTTHALGADGIPAGIVARLPLGSPTVLAPAPRA